MKLFYTNRGVFTEEQYAELLEACGPEEVKSYGEAGVYEGSGNGEYGTSECGAGGEVGMDEGGPSTRSAIDNEEIQASMDDFGGVDDEVAELVDPDELPGVGGIGSITHLGMGSDTEDDITGHDDWMSDDDQDYFGKPGGDGWSAEDEEKWQVDTLRGIDDIDEELQHSQTGFADMQPAVVKEFRAAGQKKNSTHSRSGGGVSPCSLAASGEDDVSSSVDTKGAGAQEVSPPGWKGSVKAMKKHKDIDNPYALAWWMKDKGDKAHYKSSDASPPVKKKEFKKKDDEDKAGDLNEQQQSVPESGAEDWRLLYRKVGAAQRVIMQDWPQITDALVAKGIDAAKAMNAVRAMEKILDGLSSDLQLFKNVSKAQKRASMAMSRNPAIKQYIPVELGGEFSE